MAYNYRDKPQRNHDNRDDLADLDDGQEANFSDTELNDVDEDINTAAAGRPRIVSTG